MYARLIRFCVADVGSFGRGQTHIVHGTPAAVTQEAAQTAAKLCGAGFVRYWLDNSRPSRAPQGHAGLAG
jgi:hypothetical protein